MAQSISANVNVAPERMLQVELLRSRQGDSSSCPSTASEMGNSPSRVTARLVKN
ncbi:hypothetical protein GA0061101_12580 [Rhizobium lusitanum]|uniref:Uncharacterized protein n=1 Tax=Rhizobium lusitanum TaxID=293958 RepID=A0A1C3X5I8_9HYPH|nr:hypothetical protein GA0061101_12580 [Rhizobium lusitanum]